MALQAMVTRRFDVFDPVVLTVGISLLSELALRRLASASANPLLL